MNQEHGVDQLCNISLKTTGDFEFKILQNAYQNGEKISESEKRYKRYLKKIKFWRIGDKSFEDIKNEIENVLSMKTTSENLDLKKRCINLIDGYFLKILEKY